MLSLFLIMSTSSVVSFVPSVLPHKESALKASNWKDEQLRAQREVLARRQSREGRKNYFDDVNKKRRQATEKVEMWSFQRDSNQDPLIAWKKLRSEGKIGNLKTGYGIDGVKREGGLPIPLPSFGVGGEAGVGGEYDNGERFDLRLPYAEQGWVDESADPMKQLSNFFGGDNKKNKKNDESKKSLADEKDNGAVSFRWPWQQ
uniref:Uncharacterized protein n=1 Tax=Aureoumbra lagunensis TaxID=44058 RepID=A0A7S3NIK9_9STRA|mmetsp:Transcript_22386/g.28980  ORF Transcript_22386/g.28980 Transcript_22386/m.28980 type:complete len:202 (+) Transcript_22386:55-660(+)